MRTPFPSVQLAFSPTLTMSISWFILSLVLDLNRSTHALDFNPDPREIQNDIPNIQPLCAYNDVRDDDHDHGHLHDHDPIDAFKWVTEPGDFFDNAESATDATDADLSNPSTDPPAEPPVQYQYLGCISFEGYSDLLRHHRVRGLKEPSRANCLEHCRRQKDASLAYHSIYHRSCYCAPKTQQPKIRWLVDGSDYVGNCLGGGGVSVDFLSIPFIFDGCYTSFYGFPYNTTHVRGPLDCLEDTCESSDGTATLYPQGDGWRCTCYRYPTEGVLSRRCGWGAEMGYYRVWEQPEPTRAV